MDDPSLSSWLIRAPWENIETTKSNSTFCFNIFFSQLMALIFVGTNICALRLQLTCLIDTPLYILGCFYVFFILFWLASIRLFAYPRYSTFLIAILESQANILQIISFKYINFKMYFVAYITTLFWRYLLTLAVVGRRQFGKMNYLGLVILFSGSALSLFFAIYNDEFVTNKENFVIGVSVSFAASFLFALTDVLHEYFFLDGRSVYEYQFWYGIVGFILCGVEGTILKEENKIGNIKFSVEAS